MSEQIPQDFQQGPPPLVEPPLQQQQNNTDDDSNNQKIPFPSAEEVEKFSSDRTPPYQVASASAGKFLRISVSEKDFNKETGDLTDEATNRIESEVRSKVHDHNMKRQMISGYCSAARDMYKNGKDQDRFEIFAWSCMLHWRGERSSSDRITTAPLKLELGMGTGMSRKSDSTMKKLDQIKISLPSKVGKEEGEK